MNDNDVEARFRSMMETEFGDEFTDLDTHPQSPSEPSDASPTAVPEIEKATKPSEPGRIEGIVLFSPSPQGPRDWTAKDVDDSEDYKPDPLPPPGRLSSTALVGIVLMVGGGLVVVAMMLGFASKSWGMWVGFGSVCAGTLLLFSRLPRDHSHDDNDGAIV